MHIKVRLVNTNNIDDKKEAVLIVSKLTTVSELKEMVKNKLDVAEHEQRLYYMGKQLSDEYKIFDYDIKVNDVIQVMIKPKTTENADREIDKKKSKKNDQETDIKHEAGCSTSNGSSTSIETTKNIEILTESKFYKIGDMLDVKISPSSAWFEGKLLKMFKKQSNASNKDDSENNSTLANVIDQTVSDDTLDICKNNEDDIVFQVQYENSTETTDVPFENIRPRARKELKLNDIKIGNTVMVYFNAEEPTEPGNSWYDMKVCEIKNGRTCKQLIGTVFVGDGVELNDCVIEMKDKIYVIEKPKLLNDRTSEKDESIPSRRVAPNCARCNDVEEKKCKECGCSVCGGKDEPGKIILCDECNLGFHITCLKPPLEEVPDVDEWYCPECKNDTDEIVKPGDKLKQSKKKAKKPAASSTCKRDWGQGMACAGRVKECTIVPPNHFGPIPGIDVGTCWKFRLQVSEAGVHRPPVAGIHGREKEGAYSLVLSGGYEDDIDNGDDFLYTGSGGRDLSGNKRTAQQSNNQELTRMNRALAVNCNAKINVETGAESQDWQGGKPVRVSRSYKAAIHSKYAPKEGIRYDGLYKVVKYYPEKGKSGFIVWRYLLKRDDPEPAPWAPNGKELDIIYPENYPVEEKEENKNKKLKRKNDSSQTETVNSKKNKVEQYVVPIRIQTLIQQDKANARLWNECSNMCSEGKQSYLKHVEKTFECICCLELLFKPVTTQCHHNICRSCLTRSFAAEVYCCPYCRGSIDKNAAKEINSDLQAILEELFPGYGATRH